MSATVTVKNNTRIRINSRTKYGLIYNAYSVTDARGLAPTDYHIPTETEWNTLFTYLTNNGYGYGGSGTDWAFSISSIIDWNTGPTTPTQGSPGYDKPTNNSTGLGLLPNGYRISSAFQKKLDSGYYWEGNKMVSTWRGIGIAYYWNTSDTVVIQTPYGWPGLSVRCMRDNDTGWVEGQTVKDYDGNVYDTVKIGNQIWMKQNLAVIHFKDGSLIPEITGGAAWEAATGAALCAYNNNWSDVFA
jgi:uncharacterized protein (TIGR02145 family)